MKGTVKSFDEIRGFGYIEQEDAHGNEIFVNCTDIANGERRLFAGDEVEYQIRKSTRCENAVNVVVIKKAIIPKKSVQSVKLYESLYQQAATGNKKGRESGASPRKIRSFSNTKTSTRQQRQGQGYS